MTMRPSVIDRQRAPRHHHRFVEAVLPGEMIAGRAVDVAVRGVDLQDLLRLLLELRLPALQEAHRCPQRTGLQAVRIDFQRRVNRRRGIVQASIVERRRGHEQVPGHRVRIDLQRLLDRRLRLRRILFHQQGGKANVGGDIGVIRFQCDPERFHGLFGLVFLEKQQPPFRIDDRVVRRQLVRGSVIPLDCLTEQAAVGGEAGEQRGRPAEPEILCGGAWLKRKYPPKRRRTIRAPPQHQLQ